MAPAWWGDPVDPTPLLSMLGPWGVTLLLFLGAWTALDAAAVGQFMVGRPLVAATLGGWVAGDPAAGMLAGALLEALHLAQVPAGGARLPDPGPGSVVAGGVAALAGSGAGAGVGAAAGAGSAGAAGGALALALTLGVGLSLLGGRLVERHRKANADRVAAGWSRGDPLGGVLRGALSRGAIRGAALVAGGLAVASLVSPAVMARWPLSPGGTVALLAVPAFLGLGSVARTPVPGHRRGIGLLAVGVLAGAAAGVLFGALFGGGGAGAGVGASFGVGVGPEVLGRTGGTP